MPAGKVVTKMECARGGSRSPCSGPATRRCGRCKAVAYCSISHQVSHWRFHKEECERFKRQMEQLDILNDFPFTFSREATVEVSEKREKRCSLLTRHEVHNLGMWMFECGCGPPFLALDESRLIQDWNLSRNLCPCKEPSSPLSKSLRSWKDYYDWRCIPLYSPVCVLLHWPLTIYWAVQLANLSSLVSERSNKLCIHYLGPEKELQQLAVFGELSALFPGMKVHIDLIGPAIPKHRDGEQIDLGSYAHCSQNECSCRSCGMASVVSLQLHEGCYHDRYNEIARESFPDLIIAPNAGVAAYSSWISTIELIKEIEVATFFSDFCEEAAHLATCYISRVTGCRPTIPVQLNPFRQPLAIEDSALLLPCYSNCFIFGI